MTNDETNQPWPEQVLPAMPDPLELVELKRSDKDFLRHVLAQFEDDERDGGSAERADRAAHLRTILAPVMQGE